MLGDRIATLRKSHGFNQTQLGSRLGVVQATVSAWEKERSTPDVGQLKRIADLFGLTVDQLIGSPPPRHRTTKQAWMTTYLQSEYGLLDTPEMANLACDVVDLLVRYLTKNTNVFSEKYNDSEDDLKSAWSREKAWKQVDNSNIPGN